MNLGDYFSLSGSQSTWDLADLAFFQLLGDFYSKTQLQFFQEVFAPQFATVLRMECFGGDLACLLAPEPILSMGLRT